MKILVKYVDFHWDNYQGGSGQSFNFSTLIEVSDELEISDLLAEVYQKLGEACEKNRPFRQQQSCAIQSIEILDR